MATCGEGEGYIDDDAGYLHVRGPQTIPVQILEIAPCPHPTIETKVDTYSYSLVGTRLSSLLYAI